MYIKVEYVADKGRFNKSIDVFNRKKVNECFIKNCETKIIDEKGDLLKHNTLNL